MKIHEVKRVGKKYETKYDSISIDVLAEAGLVIWFKKVGSVHLYLCHVIKSFIVTSSDIKNHLYEGTGWWTS